METMFRVAFVGFSVEVTCKACDEKIGIKNETPSSARDRMIEKFRKQHEQAHEPKADK